MASPTAPGAPQSRPQQRLCVVLPTATYLLTWWAVLLLHTFTAIFVLGAAFAHIMISLPAIARATSALHIPVLLKRITGLGYLIVALLHLLAAGRMIYRSIVARELTMMGTESRAASRGPRKATVTATTTMSGIQPASARVAYRRLVKLWATVFGSYGYLGIHGPLFSPSLLLREVVEVGMQSYQLWCLSYYVSRPWINNFAVATVVLNCFSISIVNRLFRKRQGLKRLMHLVVDMYLDFTCAVIVPMLVLMPYAVAFNWEKNEYPIELIANDVWMSKAVAEARQVLVTTYLDFFASLMPQYSIFSCLRLLKRLIERKQVRRIHSHRAAITSHNQLVARQKTSVDLMRAESTTLSTTTDVSLQQESQGRGMRLVGACVTCWAAVVLGFHLNSAVFSQSETLPGCQLYVRPWLASNVSCSVMYINCFYRNISGTADELAAVLNQLERVVLTKVVFIRCPALTIPSNIGEFSTLQSLEIGASTLVSWPAQAAVTEALHPSLGNVFFVQSNVSTIPPGLLHSELPQTMTSVVFLNCSIAELPENLGDIWSTSKLERLGLENTHVKKIPRSIGRIPLQLLWMTSNAIEDFPDGMFANSKFLSIRLSGNPLVRLPSTVGDVSLLRELLIEYTNVSSLPSWTMNWLDATSDPKSQSHRSFFGSLVCDPTRTSSVKDTWRVCSEDSQTRYGSMPLDVTKDKYIY